MKPFILAPSVLVVALLLSACGGGSDGGSSATPPTQPAPQPQPTPPAPETPAVVPPPASNTTSVARNAGFTVTLNSAIDKATVDSTSVQLVGPEGNVIPTQASVDGANLKLAPQMGSLPGGTTYTAKLSTAIKTSAGQNLPAASSTTFTTAAQQWEQQAVMLDLAPVNPGNRGVRDQLILAPDGSTIAIVAHSGFRIGTGGPLYAVRLAPGASSWSAIEPIPIENDHSLGLSNAVVAPNGNIYVAWATASTFLAEGIFVGTYDAATRSWTTVRVDIPGEQLNPALSMDAKGNLYLLTTARDGLSLSFTRRPAGASAWTPADKIVSAASDAYIVSATQQSDKDGNLIAAWRDTRGAKPGLYTSRYRAATATWDTPVLVDPRIDSDQFALLVDDRAGAVLAWVQLSAQVADYRTVTTVRSAPGAAAWGPLTAASELIGRIKEPRLIASPAGAVTLVYDAEQGINAVRSEPGSNAWNVAGTQTVTTGGAGVQTSVDAAGNVNLLYTAWLPGSTGPALARYSPSTSKWTSELIAPLASADGVPMSGDNLVSHPNGDVVVMFSSPRLLGARRLR